MRNRLFPSLAIAMSLLLAACSSGPAASPTEQYLADARSGLRTSDFNAALKNLERAIKSAGDEPAGQQAAVLRVALVTALADSGKQMAEAYGVGAKEPAAKARLGPFVQMRSDYYGVARSRLMDAMQSVMNQRAKLGSNPLSIEVTFPGTTGGADSTVAKIKNGQWVGDGERFAAELQADRNALARIFSAMAGAGENVNKGQQIFSSGKVDIDPRVYLIELSSSFLEIASMFEARALNEPDRLRTTHEVVRGNLDVALRLLAAKPDKDLEARAKKMRAECEKTLKKLGA